MLPADRTPAPIRGALLAVLMGGALGGAALGDDAASAGSAVPRESASDAARAELVAVIERYERRQMDEDPLVAVAWSDAPLAGFAEADPAALERRYVADMTLLEALDGIERRRLDEASRIDHRILRLALTERVEAHRLGLDLMAVTHLGGFHLDAIRAAERARPSTVTAYEAYIAWLQSFPRHVDQQIATLRRGLAQGRVPACAVAQRLSPLAVSQIVVQAEESPFFSPFRRVPRTFGPRARDSLARRGRAAVQSGAVEGFRRFAAFLLSDYVPACRDEGLFAIPRGDEIYAFLLRRETTTDATADELHAWGLERVAAARERMAAAAAATGFDGGLDAFVRRLRADPRHRASTPEELLGRAAWLLKRIEGELPGLFGALPRSPLGLREIPDVLAPHWTTAAYDPADTLDLGAGFVYVNTDRLEARPLYELPALMLHEGVPGHHLQIALARENEALPRFRRAREFTAFSEGWALYAESLGDELGLYEDPFDAFARESLAAWRACRLVVDTGLHTRGWTRQRAIDYLQANTALTLPNIESEIDRYLAQPGQAVAYAVGERHLVDLRRRAEERLRGRFDLRAFHDAVLARGSLPLDLLTWSVETWIEERAAARPR